MRLTPAILTRCVLPVVAVLFFISITGCSANFSAVAPSTDTANLGVLRGSVYGGQQPVSGSTVSVYAVSTAGYGAASTLLSPVPAITGADGSFSVTDLYRCTAGQQVYLYVNGGNPGVASSLSDPLPSNSAIGLMAVLGTCPANGTLADTLPTVYINEISTIAAAYALAPYAVDATHIGNANTAQSLNGMANAIVNAGKIFDVSGAHGLSATKASPVGFGILPQALINTLGNILASCVNTVTSTSLTGGTVLSDICTTLVTTATSDGTASGTQPTDTASAAINMAHHPGLNVAALLALESATPPFQPAYTGNLTDLSLYVVYLGPGVITPKDLAIDSQGDVWFTNYETDSGASYTKLSNAGSLISPSGGYSAGQDEQGGYGIAIDTADDAWGDSRPMITDPTLATVYKFSSTGTALSPETGYQTGLINNSGLTIDPTGNVWMVDFYGNTVVELSNTGAVLSPTALSPPLNLPGYTAGGLNAGLELASDPSGNIWIENAGALVELSNGGTALTGSTGFTGGGLGQNGGSGGLAIDHAGSVWVANLSSNSLTKVSGSRSLLSPGNGYTASSLVEPARVAIDGDGNAWANNSGAGGLTEFSNSGSVLSGTYGYTGGGFLSNNTVEDGMANGFGLGVDSSGDVWTVETSGQINGYLLNDNCVYEFIGIAAPVVTPLAVGVTNNTLGVRP